MIWILKIIKVVKKFFCSSSACRQLHSCISFLCCISLLSYLSLYLPLITLLSILAQHSTHHSWYAFFLSILAYHFAHRRPFRHCCTSLSLSLSSSFLRSRSTLSDFNCILQSHTNMSIVFSWSSFSPCNHPYGWLSYCFLSIWLCLIALVCSDIFLYRNERW